jgi:hypothetical protein
MFLNPFKTEEAEPLRQRRKWRDPRCDAYAVSGANHLTHMGASFAANFIANVNARHLLRWPPTVLRQVCQTQYE